LTKLPIAFVCQVEPPAPRLRHDPKLERETLSSKLPSKEAMVAYAQCTNSPINDREEIYCGPLTCILHSDRELVNPCLFRSTVGLNGPSAIIKTQ
jgi:hypothetical protein